MHFGACNVVNFAQNAFFLEKHTFCSNFVRKGGKLIISSKNAQNSRFPISKTILVDEYSNLESELQKKIDDFQKHQNETFLKNVFEKRFSSARGVQKHPCLGCSVCFYRVKSELQF